MGQMRNIVIVAYDLRWPDMFRQAAEELRAVFGDECLAIHHIGSTAIPGMRAKPIIDLMPVVRTLKAVEAHHPALIRRGYESKGENGIPGRRYFVKGSDDRRTHQVHTYEPEHPEVARHLGFRDYLIAHPEAARQYAELKTGLARQFPHDIDGYIGGKNGFIRATIQKALDGELD